MTIKTLRNRFSACILAAVTVLAAIPAVPVHAESGTVYSCTINRSYSNPVTGEIEDAGGEASYTTGQGMVEGCVYGSGMLEVTDSGNYYLTVRLGLIDYTSNQSFTVQNVGDSGWSGTSTAVTATGSDSNGTTADLCMQVPSENCIVRGSMYVSPMGRDVIFYFYPSNYSEGNSVGMTPAFVTEASFGKGASGDVKKLLRWALTCAAAIEIVMVALVWTFTDPFIAVFNSENNQLLLEYAHTGLRLYFLGFLFAGVNIMLVAYFSATANPRPAIIGSLLRGAIAIGICAIILSRILGMNGVWLSFLASEMITFAVILILSKYKESRKTNEYA